MTEKNGDQDLFGHEDGVSLQMSRERITQELLAVETTVSQWSNLSTEAKIEKIEQIVRIVSFRIRLTLFACESAACFKEILLRNWR